MTRLAISLAALSLSLTGCAVYELGTRYTSAFDAHDRRAGWNLPWDFYIETRQETRVEFWVKLSAAKEFTLTGQLQVLDGHDFSLAWRPCLSLDRGSRLCAESAIAGWAARKKEELPYYRFAEYLPNQPWQRRFDDGSARESSDRLTRASLDERVGYRGDPVPRLGVSVTWIFRCPDGCPSHFSLDVAKLVDFGGESVTPAVVEFEREWVGRHDYAFH